MDEKQPYNTGVQELFSNFAKDPCLKKHCRGTCPVGYTCVRAVPPRSGEFRLDLSGCNLKCPFCWTINKPHLWNPKEIFGYIKCRFREYYASNLNVDIAYLRVTGGEPILSERRANHLLDLFKLVDEDVSQSKFYGIWKTRRSPQNLMGRKNIKIQTNGIMIPKLINVFVNKLVNFRNIAFTFEVSLKGTNPNEFEILSGGLRGEMFFEQIRAITELGKYEDQGYPIFVRGILGIFHSAQYDLVFPDNDERMMLNPDREFIETVTKLRNMSRTQERVYVEPLRFTDQMRETENNCKNLGIITSSKVGKNIEPGKKIRLKNTYLWKVIN
jgi:uncharacterized Fe-S cluster-containing radical SAM superfamily protein